HVPVEFAVTVYEALMQAGRSFGLVNAGYRAIESCRLEKGYRAWGADIGPDHTPIEAGMAWAVKDRSGVDFRGRAVSVGPREGVASLAPRRFVARLPGERTELLGIDRANEAEAAARAAELGIGPPVFGELDGVGTLVTELVPGGHLEPDAFIARLGEVVPLIA